MIRLKAKNAEPAILRSQAVTNAKRRMSDKVRIGGKLSSKDFPSAHWLHDDVRLTLWKHHQKKCCYCERVREAKREPDIEHFRPKGRVTSVRRKNSGYWWLAYDWNNLFFSCKACNQEYKKNEFPLIKGKRARNASSRLSDEVPFLINPIDDKPEDLIDYIWDDGIKIPIAKPVGKDDAGRGAKTISILGLDRPLLNEERGQLLLTLNAIAEEMHAARHFDKPRIEGRAALRILKETSSKKNFTGFRRAYFRAQGLGEYIAND
jgi:uncharacterized protein (TIGR02646 family)